MAQPPHLVERRGRYREPSGSSRARGRPVHTWRITFRPERGARRLVADVDAEYVETEPYGPHQVLWRTQMVVGRPQRVIVWRLRRDEASVERLCSADNAREEQHDAEGRQGDSDRPEDADGQLATVVRVHERRG